MASIRAAGVPPPGSTPTGWPWRGNPRWPGRWSSWS